MYLLVAATAQQQDVRSVASQLCEPAPWQNMVQLHHVVRKYAAADRACVFLLLVHAHLDILGAFLSWIVAQVSTLAQTAVR